MSINYVLRVGLLIVFRFHLLDVLVDVGQLSGILLACFGDARLVLLHLVEVLVGIGLVEPGPQIRVLQLVHHVLAILQSSLEIP